MAKSLAKDRDVAVHTVWIDIRTHRRLRDLAGAVAVAVFAVKGNIKWKALTERSLEKRFGRLRVSFPSGQMSCADYFRASAKCMQTEVKNYEAQGLPAEHPEESPLTEEQFSKIAEESMSAAVKLAAMTSSWTQKELRSALAMNPAAYECDGEAEAQGLDEEVPVDQGSLFAQSLCLREGG